MKTVALISMVALTAISVSASAVERVRGYTKRDGTYVAPHYRSSPNSTRIDNYSTQGNLNPYNGNVGTKPLYDTTPTYQPPKLRY